MDEQSFIKRKRILEAIDTLRERKNRPDTKRIINYLVRHHNVPPSETRSDLEWCVSNKSVLCVEYKGAVSYRNARKKNHHKSRIGMQRKSKVSKNFMELLTNIFAELAMEEPHYLEVGVPATEIIQFILAKDSVRYSKRKITMLLEVQVRRRDLIKLENGNFMLGPCSENKHKEIKNKKTAVIMSSTRKESQPDSTSEQKPKQPKTSTQSNLKLPSKGRGRPRKVPVQEQATLDIAENMDSDMKGGIQKLGRRLKIAKKVYDPSDTYAPKTDSQPKKRQNQKFNSPNTILNKPIHPSKSLKKSHKNDEDWRPSSYYSAEFSRDEAGVCSVCHNANEKSGTMVTCIECSNKAHHKCLNGDDMMLKMSPDNTWQCTNCKTCVVCFQTSNAGNLIVCSVCTDGYHATCLQPNITDNNQKWLCANCQDNEEMKPDEIQFHIGEAISYNIIDADSDELPRRGKYSQPKNSESGIPKKNYSKSSIKLENSDDEFSDSKSQTPESSSNYETPSQSPVASSSGIRRKKYLDSSKNEENDVEEDSSDSSSRESPVASVSSTQEKSDSNSQKREKYCGIDSENLDSSVPDASHWTPDEVYEYFAKIISEDEAKIFREEGIDGRSLLGLRRSDVLNNLKLELGPALEVFRHITKLQVRRDDRSLYWL
ncbi:unnamed protein product [Ceutorhynchus assimilis]|uniref:Uncharacterized protein n=1 Tax=Ceutorhynchus assimilis TaxID=467358 RepID=A0A9N9MIA1_9CUCU|nr:unnamed protein product [Ceutorhynchus assimilis]